MEQSLESGEISMNTDDCKDGGGPTSRRTRIRANNGTDRTSSVDVHAVLLLAILLLSGMAHAQQLPSSTTGLLPSSTNHDMEEEDFFSASSNIRHRPSYSRVLQTMEGSCSGSKLEAGMQLAQGSYLWYVCFVVSSLFHCIIANTPLRLKM